MADGVLGKYGTILATSFIYCLGHAALAADDTRRGLAIGLACPLRGGHQGMRVGQRRRSVRPGESALGDEGLRLVLFLTVNFGSFFATLLMPYLLNKLEFGPRWAFGVPGVFMALATICFWLGRYKFVHVPPGGLGFIREVVSRRRALGDRPADRDLSVRSRVLVVV